MSASSAKSGVPATATSVLPSPDLAVASTAAPLQSAVRTEREQAAPALLLGQELEAAARLQQSLLPKVFPSIPGMSLAGFCRSAHQVGGDFYDVVPLGGQRILLAIADVMGKGIPAALFAATLRAVIRSLPAATERPSELMTRINNLVFADLSAMDMFITLELVLVDAEAGSLRIGSAGHCPLIWADAAGRIGMVAPEGLPLGIQAQSHFGEVCLPLNQVHSAVLFTDGVTETCAPDGELFGQDRLEKILSCSVLEKTSPEAIAQNVLAQLKAFEGDAPHRDDQTVLILGANVAAMPALGAPLALSGLKSAV
jgi:phosphoserine phosphatase RsbU/P